ncbi:MAG: hypothetical protein LC751_20685 [Actinobacteria bacterium]|nr:hypothetical protein [Actinomycetota bacterium]
MVYVLLDATNREQHADQSSTSPDDSRQLNIDQSELVGEMRDQIDWLRREVERKDTIIMSLTQRIPELEAPSDERGTPEMVSKGPSRGAAADADDAPEPQESVQRRSWLHRFFYGPEPRSRLLLGLGKQ